MKSYECGICGGVGHNRASCGRNSQPNKVKHSPLNVENFTNTSHRPLPPSMKKENQRKEISNAYDHLISRSETSEQRNLNEPEKLSTPKVEKVQPETSTVQRLQFPNEQHIGEIGAPITTMGEVKKIKTIQSRPTNYSYSNFSNSQLFVVDVEGKDVIFYSTASWAFDSDEVSEGDTIIFEGLVRSHEPPYATGQPRTKLGRVKLLENLNNL